MPRLAFVPDLLWSGGSFHPSGTSLAVEDGVVVSVGPFVPPGYTKVPLGGRLLVPGFVSAHGHAFQRVLRGRAERRRGAGGRPGAAKKADDFWGWREAMFAAAARLGPEALEVVARFAFAELLRAGVTCAGEFHYLHRDPDGRPYADPIELERRVVRASKAVGIRLVLLRAAYAREGAGGDPHPAQRRFIEESPEAFLAAFERLSGAVALEPLVSLGIAPHSVRACPPPWLAALAEAARRRGLPLHVHAAEQPAEVAACRAEHGLSPVALLAREGALGPATTLVHAIHVDDADVAAIGAAGATVCACPLTERNLGDGVVPADRLVAAGARLALGVDSHAEVDLAGEWRALEGHLRLVRGERAVLDDPPGSLPGRLFAAATTGGMASLGLAGGRLAPGEPADFLLLDSDDPSLAGAAEGASGAGVGEALLQAIVFGLSPSAVKSTFVAGEPVIEDGWPGPGRPAGIALLEDFRRVMKALWGAS